MLKIQFCLIFEFIFLILVIPTLIRTAMTMVASKLFSYSMKKQNNICHCVFGVNTTFLFFLLCGLQRGIIAPFWLLHLSFLQPWVLPPSIRQSTPPYPDLPIICQLLPRLLLPAISPSHHRSLKTATLPVHCPPQTH